MLVALGIVPKHKLPYGSFDVGQIRVQVAKISTIISIPTTSTHSRIDEAPVAHSSAKLNIRYRETPDNSTKLAMLIPRETLDLRTKLAILVLIAGNSTAFYHNQIYR